MIGKVGFGTDFGATRSIDENEPGAIFQLMEQGEIVSGVPEWKVSHL